MSVLKEKGVISDGDIVAVLLNGLPCLAVIYDSKLNSPQLSDNQKHTLIAMYCDSPIAVVDPKNPQDWRSGDEMEPAMTMAWLMENCTKIRSANPHEIEAVYPAAEEIGKRPRAYSEEEAVRMLLERVRAVTEEWVKDPDVSTDERCHGVAKSILGLLDGDSELLPAMKLSLAPRTAITNYREADGQNWYKKGQVINDNISLRDKYASYHYQQTYVPE